MGRDLIQESEKPRLSDGRTSVFAKFCSSSSSFAASGLISRCSQQTTWVKSERPWTAPSISRQATHTRPTVRRPLFHTRTRGFYSILGACASAPRASHHSPPALLDRLRLKSNLLGNLARAKADLDQEGRLACRDGGNEAISLIRISLQLARRTARAWTPTPSGRRNDWSSSAPLQTPVQTHASTACPHVPVSVQESCQEAQ